LGKVHLNFAGILGDRIIKKKGEREEEKRKG